MKWVYMKPGDIHLPAYNRIKISRKPIQGWTKICECDKTIMKIYGFLPQFQSIHCKVGCAKKIANYILYNTEIGKSTMVTFTKTLNDKFKKQCVIDDSYVKINGSIYVHHKKKLAHHDVDVVDLLANTPLCIERLVDNIKSEPNLLKL